MAKERDEAFWAAGWSERGEVPGPVEDGSDAAWTEYDLWSERLEQAVQARRRKLEELDTEDIMRVVRQRNRVCPKARAWRTLYLLLPTRIEGERITRPPYPVDPASLRTMTDLQKQLRLRSQIEWAEMNGALPEVAEFVNSLSEAEWHHFDASDWPTITGPVASAQRAHQ